MNRIIPENRHFTISEVYEQWSEVSRTVAYEIITEHLQYRKICARWVPRMLTDAHKAVRMDAALMFFGTLRTGWQRVPRPNCYRG